MLLKQFTFWHEAVNDGYELKPVDYSQCRLPCSEITLLGNLPTFFFWNNFASSQKKSWNNQVISKVFVGQYKRGFECNKLGWKIVIFEWLFWASWEAACKWSLLKVDSIKDSSLVNINRVKFKISKRCSCIQYGILSFAGMKPPLLSPTKNLSP